MSYFAPPVPPGLSVWLIVSLARDCREGSLVMFYEETVSYVRLFR